MNIRDEISKEIYRTIENLETCKDEEYSKKRPNFKLIQFINDELELLYFDYLYTT